MLSNCLLGSINSIIIQWKSVFSYRKSIKFVILFCVTFAIVNHVILIIIEPLKGTQVPHRRFPINYPTILITTHSVHVVKDFLFWFLCLFFGFLLVLFVCSFYVFLHEESILNRWNWIKINVKNRYITSVVRNTYSVWCQFINQ